MVIDFQMLQYFGVDDGAISDDDINEESIGNLDIVRSCNDLSSLVSVYRFIFYSLFFIFIFIFILIIYFPISKLPNN
jgi:hypothetical protein